MPKPLQFPTTVKAGATAVKIYRNLLRVPITSGPKANTGAVASYDSYLVVHYRAGKRQRQRFNSLELAQTEAARVRALLLNEDASGLQLAGRDLLAFSQANRVAQQFGVALDPLANEHAAANKNSRRGEPPRDRAVFTTAANASLASQLVTVSNYATTNVPLGVAVVSADAQDPVFLGQGLQVFQTVPAPPWVNGTATGVPSGRFSHSAVWTSQQLLVWGGDLGAGTYSAGGGAYSPSSDSWQNIASFQAPSARASHTAVWTGTEMVVWGGFGSGVYQATGARYLPSQQTWAAVAATGAPSGRDGHAAVWTGSRMLVWSGRNNTGLLADGGSYAPGTDAWTALPSAGAPEGRRFTTAVWTGTNMIVWGGQGLDGELASGGRLVCDAGGLPVSWLATSAVGAPTARIGHTAVWTGSRMIVWGGFQGSTYLGNGAAYDPVADVWTPLSTTLAPTARTAHIAVWTGSEMLVFGGEDGTGALLSGAAYNPAKNTWRSLNTSTGAVARSKGTAVWTSSELVLFGGVAAGSPLAQPQRLTPQPAFYFYRKP